MTTGEWFDSLSRSEKTAITKAAKYAAENHREPAKKLKSGIEKILGPSEKWESAEHNPEIIAQDITDKAPALHGFGVLRADGYQEWVWHTVNDSRVDDDCRALNNKVFPITTQFAPAHINCRCAPQPWGNPVEVPGSFEPIDDDDVDDDAIAKVAEPESPSDKNAGNKISDDTISAWSTGSMAPIRAQSEKIISGKKPSKDFAGKAATEMMAAIENSPIQKEMFRGLSLTPAELKKYKEGSEITTGISSFTKASDLASEWAGFAAGGRGGRPVVLTLRGARGADISGHKIIEEFGFAHQEEILAYGKFKVSSFNEKDGVVFIDLVPV